jgi:hypothetical protein
MTMSEEVAVNWVSIDQAAEKLGTTSLNVLMHIKRGLLLGEDQDGFWQVDIHSLTELLRQRCDGEAPLVCQSACSIKAGCCSSCA